MNFYGISQLINGIFALVLGVFVTLQKPRKKVYKTFSGFCFSISGWCLSYFIWQTQNYPEPAMLWLRILMTIMTLIQSFFLHFSIVVTDNENKYKNLIKPSYIWSGLSSIIFFSGLGFEKVPKVKLFAKFWPDANIFTFLFVIIQMALVIYALYILFKSLKAALDPKKKNQFKYLFIMSIIAWGGGLTHWLLFFNIPIEPIGSPTVAIYLAVLAYAILRHQLLDINIVIKKGVIYSISVSILTAIYLIIVFFSEQIFRGVTGYRSNMLTICILISFVLLFQPIKNKIQRFIDSRFFRGSINEIDEENIKLRGELQKSEKLKAVATLAAGMAHEIKNPLTSIKTFTEFIDKKKDDPEFIGKFKEIVGAEVDRINYIVKELLEFSKPSDLSVKDSDINNLLDEITNLLNNSFIKNNIKITRKYARLPIIKVDPAQMKQVFLNLLLNAIDAMPSAGIITIKTDLDTSHKSPPPGPKKVIISISDSGCGISKDDLKHIFDPFFTRKDGGTGLGLSVVHGIIEKHGGKIKVTSDIATGTKFTILLEQSQ